MKQTLLTFLVAAALLAVGIPARATETKPKAKPGRLEKSFTVESKYLVMPIQNKGKGNTVIQLYVGAEKVRSYKVQLAPTAAEADWYAFFTIENYKGKPARVAVESATEEGFAHHSGRRELL